MEKCNDEPDIEEQPDSNGDSNDSNSNNCNHGEYLFNSAPGASRALRQLIDDDLRSGTSVNLLKGKNSSLIFSKSKSWPS